MRTSHVTGARLATLLVALAATSLTNADVLQERDGWIDVLSIQVEANGLIIIVCRDLGELQLADGTYSAGGEIDAKVDDHRLVSLNGPDLKMDSFLLADDGSVMINIGVGEKPLPEGVYRLERSRRGGRGNDLQVTDFRVRDGRIVSAQVESF